MMEDEKIISSNNNFTTLIELAERFPMNLLCADVNSSLIVKTGLTIDQICMWANKAQVFHIDNTMLFLM